MKNFEYREYRENFPGFSEETVNALSSLGAEGWRIIRVDGEYYTRKFLLEREITDSPENV
jgi:hypothetical protein